MESKSYKICPICECKVLLERYKTHITEKHSPEEDLKRIILQHQIENNRKQRAVVGEEIVHCELCGIEVKRKNLNKHKYNSHKKNKY